MYTLYKLIKGDLIQLVGVSRYEPIPNVRDVIVFSTNGSRSVASKLSGGDYDGDRIFICWDKKLNEALMISNYDPPEHTDPRYKKKEYSKLSSPYPHDKFLTKNTSRKLKELYLDSVSGIGNQLGRVSNLWKESCIEHGVCADRTLKLAKLCSYYVDMEKYGLQNKQLEPWVYENRKNPKKRKVISLVDKIKSRISEDIFRIETNQPFALFENLAPNRKRNQNLVQLAEMFHWKKYEVIAREMMNEYNKDISKIIDLHKDSQFQNQRKYQLILKHTKLIKEYENRNAVLLPGDFNKGLALAIYMVCYDGNKKPYEYCWVCAGKFLCRLHADFLESNVSGVAHTICSRNIANGVKIY